MASKDFTAGRIAALLLAAFCEEGLNDCSAFGSEDARGYFDLVIETSVAEDLETTTHRPAFGIIAAVDQAPNACLNHGTGAHRARLDSNVESRAREAVVPKQSRGLTKHDDFGVGCGVAIANRAIAGARQDFAIVHEYRTNWHFARSSRGASLRKGLLHEHDVRIRHRTRITCSFSNSRDGISNDRQQTA